MEEGKGAAAKGMSSSCVRQGKKEGTGTQPKRNCRIRATRILARREGSMRKWGVDVALLIASRAFLSFEEAGEVVRW